MRTTLLDVTESVMRDEGYAAVSSRRVAQRAGVHQQTIYYYFETMDELLLSAYQRRHQLVRSNLERALASERPLHAFWRMYSDPFDVALQFEYMALANHNELIRRESIEFTAGLRALMVDKLGPVIKAAAPNAEFMSPAGVLLALNFVGHMLGFEAAVGVRQGHTELRMFMEGCLRQIEPPVQRAKAGPEPD
jgi:AcrR family transcriptional regulator